MGTFHGPTLGHQPGLRQKTAAPTAFDRRSPNQVDRLAGTACRIAFWRSVSLANAVVPIAGIAAAIHPQLDGYPGNLYCNRPGAEW
jgi:anti-sigma-K factor RskA